MNQSVPTVIIPAIDLIPVLDNVSPSNLDFTFLNITLIPFSTYQQANVRGAYTVTGMAKF